MRDRLWYFATVERLEVEEPVVFPGGGFGLRGAEGWRGFGKLTWQRGTDHRLSVQLNVDPIESFGNNIGPVVSPEADYLTRSKGTLPQFNWNAILSPFLLLQFTLSHLDADLEIEPVSRHFRPIEVSRIDQGNQFVVRLPCLTVNCQGDASIPREARGAGSFITAGSGQEAGPYRTEADQDLDRSTLKSDLSWSLEGRRGRHAIKGGFEFVVERYAERGLDNPVLTDFTCPVEQCGVPTGTVPPPGVRLGTLALEVFEPLRYERTAAGFNAGAYVQDTWRPIPQLALNLGLRFDHEAVEAIERESFEPAREARDVLRRFDLVCDAVGTSCTGSRDPGRPVGPLPSSVTPPPGHPALELDLDDDGVLDLGGPEGALVFAPLTRPEGRGLEPFVIANANVSPRLSVSWDPWSDGRTKLFGSYGRYYDRLFLGTVTTGQLPESYSAEWNLGVLLSQQAAPGSLSKPLRGVLSSHQTDRNLSTPFTVEWTAGIEREIAPEWALAATWVKRRGVDLLQDIDVNHITCKGFDTTFGVDPMDVCGDAGRLELDRFGGLVLGTSPQGTQAGFSVPNGAIDQYVLNRNYSRILRVTNANGSDYVSFDLSLRRRQHRNWQMLLAYTWSRARGEAEAFVDIEGNDPAVSDDVKGFLDYDQRHVLKFQTAATLPHNLVAGASLEWASGLPFTFISEVSDVDDVGTLTPQRIFSLTGEKNDQRNRAWLTLNARLEKRFDFGRTTLGAFLEGGNLLDDDDLRLLQIDRDRRGAIDGFRRFGRRWQVGVAAHF